MSPEFASAVDPIFTYMLDVIAKAEAGKLAEAEPISHKIRDRFDEAERRLGNREEWDLAKYALASFADAMLVDMDWPGRSWWANNLLEFELFKTGEAFTEFYEKADRANQLTRKDALEVFYLCVVLGFRGIYGAADENPREHGLPSSIHQWTRRTAESIRHGQGRPVLSNQARPIESAPPLEGKYLLIGAVLFFALLLAIVAVILLRMFG